MSMLPHVNWYGNAQLLDFPQMDQPSWSAYLGGTAIPAIHAAGGLASFNHPFGTRAPPLSQSAQDARLAQVAAMMLPGGSLAGPGNAGALGADIIEAGYRERAGVDLAHHVGLWDVMSRNAVFLTGNGVNDDHVGQDWFGDTNNWTTSAWAASTAQADLLAALSAGRAWCGSLSAFGGPGASLDLLADGSCPMGSVSVSSLPSRSLAITATGIPAGGSVTVLQGGVDYAGSNGLASNAQVTGSYPDTAFTAGGGQVTVPVDTTGETYIRTLVLDPAGKTVAASNPVWLLRNTPPGGIPAARMA
jgi:hypothetical protein